MKIVKGDALDAEEDIIAHQVNCLGVMGAGFALCVKNKYPHVFDRYVQYVKSSRSSRLGKLQVVPCDDNKYIANLFGQSGVNAKSKQTDEVALESALLKLALFARKHNLTVAMPYKMGCGLGGGDWNEISVLIEKCLADIEYVFYQK